jgi:Carboxypeptidase regulatory-like domain
VKIGITGKLLYLFAAFALTTAASAPAQDAGTGAISGIVVDPAGRVVAHAEVLAVNQATHVSRSVTTTAEGMFRVSFLLPGAYTVSVKDAGFAENTSRPVEVSVSETTSLNVKLAIAGATASIQVTSGQEIAQLENSSLGRVVNEAAIQALPLSNRNYTQILGLSPGVLVQLPNAAELGRGTQNVTSNGAKTTANNVQFNGVDANNMANNSAANNGNTVGTAVPSPDAILEFKVQTANFDASYGHGAGANVDVVSKSGTEKFHGSAWEFVRNNIFNANDFFVKNKGLPRPALKQNQFGGTIGGHIVKDKTFFFAAYQGSTSINGLGGATTTFLPLLTSDRSAATLGAQFCPAGHLVGGVPAAGYLTHAGGTQVACDGSNINPVAVSILNVKLPSGQFAVPSPQVTVATGPTQLPQGQSTYALPASYQENQFSINIDQALGTRNTLSGKFFYSRAPTIKPIAAPAANVPGWGAQELDRNTMFVLSDTEVFTPSLINVARFGYMRFDGLSSVQKPILASAVGEGTPTGPAGPASPMPGLTVDGLFTLGDAGTPGQWEVTNSFIYQDTVSLTRGKQNMRFGAEIRRNYVDVDAPFSVDGLLDISTFDDFLLGRSAAQVGSPIGASNVTSSTGGSGIHRKDALYQDYAIFAQDDLKLTQRLTVNAGLRYEIFGSPSDSKGHLTNFDPQIATGAVPPAGTFSGYTVPSNFPGPIPQGVVRTSTPNMWTTNYGDVSPRIGFALQLTQKPTLLLRGGFGIYYDQHSGSYITSTLGQQPFSSQQIQSGSINAGATLQGPFAPLLPLTSSYPIFIPRVPNGTPFVEGVSPHLKDAHTQEYNVNVQYAFANDYLLEIGYVGTRSMDRPLSLQFNQALLASPANPINGQTTNSSNNLLQRLPYAGTSPGSLFAESSFPANYNSLQSSLTKRLQHGFQFLGSYTWSKILDETSGSGGSGLTELWLLTNDQNNPHQAYGLTDFDRSQRGVFSFIYATPKFASLPGLARHVLTDWQFSGILVIQSGSPITVTDGNAGSVYGNLSNRAQSNPGFNPSTSGSLFSRVKGHYINSNAFTRAPEAPNGTSLADQDFGNSSVGIMRGPGQHNFDMAIERIFPVTESSSFTFRTEFFNLTNTPQFANPRNSLGYGSATALVPTPSAAFGTITSSAANPRIIQFAAKYQF